MTTTFISDDKEVIAVNNISFTLYKGETLGIVGESGSGKSVTALSILKLIPNPPGRIKSGEIIYYKENGQPIILTTASEKEMRNIRGNEIAMIFQDPMTGLNPVFTVEEQMVDAILSRQGALDATAFGRKWLPSNRERRRQAHARAIQLLRQVGITDPEKRIHAYPHEFSGGMRQRVLIAMAISGRPDLLIADEPTTALDVSVQAQILRLIADLVRDINLTVLLITHNIGVVAQLCNRIAVMYAGNVVETGPVRSILRNPQHPYTRGLLAAIPTDDTPRGTLQGVPGTVPNLYVPPPGCRFAPRCAFARDACTAAVPPMVRAASSDTPDHQVACVLYQESAEAELCS